MSKPKLRVGLLIDTYELPVWQEVMLRQIMESEYAEIVLVAVNTLGQAKPKRSFVAKVTDGGAGAIVSRAVSKTLHLMYERLIDRQIRLPDANAIANCEQLLEGVSTLHVTPDHKIYSDYFLDEDVEVIRRHDVDILVRLGFGILRGSVLNAAQHGVWSFHHGDNRVNRGGPPGYWESMEGWPVTGSILQILNEDLDNGTVIYRSLSRTARFSLRDSRSNYYWKSLSFMTRAMEELHARGPKAFFEGIEEQNRNPTIYSARLYRDPTNWELARLVARKLNEKVRLVLYGMLYFDQWVLLFHLRSELSSSLWRYQKIMPPKDRFWADPHIVFRDGRYHIFIEEFPYRTEKGHIAVITMTEDGTWEDPRVVLERPYHLSYPFVFESGDQLYMIPETMQNETIELYRCTGFPHEWEFVMNLMEGLSAVDTTVVEQGGKWWLFTNIQSHPGASTDDELFLFSSEDLLSRDWDPHPMNPIVSDCTRARPAGKLFSMDGRLYRPSQNCGHRYGYGFNLSEVTALNETEYSERLVSRVEPDWDPRVVGTHTFNRVKSLHVIDALHRRRR